MLFPYHLHNLSMCQKSLLSCIHLEIQDMLFSLTLLLEEQILSNISSFQGTPLTKIERSLYFKIVFEFVFRNSVFRNYNSYLSDTINRQWNLITLPTVFYQIVLNAGSCDLVISLRQFLHLLTCFTVEDLLAYLPVQGKYE